VVDLPGTGGFSMSRELTVRSAELVYLRAGRAVATTTDLEADDSHAVQEQLARLRFVSSRLELTGRSVLDFGCGAGYVLDYLRGARPAHLAGIDCDPRIVEFARTHYPDVEFEVCDAAHPGLDLGRRFDVVLSFEVLEHIDDQATYLDNMVRHLRPGGTIVVSTPNREVFSLGERVSLHNWTHRRELNRAEFEHLLHPLLSTVTIHGQRFSDPRLQRRYVTATRHLLRRRQVRERLQASLSASSVMLRLYYRLEEYHDRLRVRASAVRRARWDDFEFTDSALERCIWFVAVGGRP
jgi:SAM-dependent methyltransferase